MHSVWLNPGNMVTRNSISLLMKKVSIKYLWPVSSLESMCRWLPLRMETGPEIRVAAVSLLSCLEVQIPHPLASWTFLRLTWSRWRHQQLVFMFVFWTWLRAQSPRSSWCGWCHVDGKKVDKGVEIGDLAASPPSVLITAQIESTVWVWVEFIDSRLFHFVHFIRYLLTWETIWLMISNSVSRSLSLMIHGTKD